MIILREFLKEKRWYNEEIKIGKFCDILYITGSKSDLSNCRNYYYSLILV